MSICLHFLCNGSKISSRKISHTLFYHVYQQAPIPVDFGHVTWRHTRVVGEHLERDSVNIYRHEKFFEQQLKKKKKAHIYYVRYPPAAFTLSLVVFDANRKKSAHQNTERSFPDLCCSLMLSVTVKFSLHSFALCLFVSLLCYNRRPLFLCYLTTPYQLQEMFSSKQNTSVLMR